MLDNILVLNNSDFKDKYKRFLDIEKKLKQIFDYNVVLPEEVEQKIDEKLGNMEINTDSYFELEDLKDELKKKFQFEASDYRHYIKQKMLISLYNDVLLLVWEKFKDTFLSKKQYLAINKVFSQEEFKELKQKENLGLIVKSVWLV